MRKELKLNPEKAKLYGQDTVRVYKIPVNRIFPGAEAFDLHQTRGVPIETTLMICSEMKMVIGWEVFFELAYKAGWNMPATIRRCIHASKDAGFNDTLMAEIEEAGNTLHKPITMRQGTKG